MSNFKAFVSPSYILDNIQYEMSRAINLYPELNENNTGTDNNVFSFISTPGLTLALTQAGFLGGIRNIYQTTTGLCYFVVGNAIYQLTLTSGTFHSAFIGTLLTSSGPANMVENNGILVVVDGVNGYYLQNGTFKQIVDPAWQGANFVCSFDGYFLFNVPGTNQFYWSDLNSISFTVAGGYGVDAKQGNSDPIIGMVVFARLLWLIGSQTTEVWTDNPGGTQTFQRIPGPYLQWGCLAPQSLVFTEYGALWIAQSPRGGASVVMTPPQGYSVGQVSTTCVDEQLQKYGQSLVGATAFVYQQKGHMFYQINPVGGTSSWVYDITQSMKTGQNVWHERTYTSPQGVQSRHLADNACVFSGYNLCGDYSAPNIYILDYNNYTDNGQTITRTRIAPHIASGFNRVFFNALTIMCRTGVGQPATATPPGQPGGNDSCSLSDSFVITPGSADPYTGYNNLTTGGQIFDSAPIGSLSGDSTIDGFAVSAFNYLSTGYFTIALESAPPDLDWTVSFTDFQNVVQTFSSLDNYDQGTYNPGPGPGGEFWQFNVPLGYDPFGGNSATYTVETSGSPFVILNWTASSVGTFPIVRYSIFRSTSPTSGFTLLATVAPDVLTYSDTTSDQYDASWYYYIVATDSTGTSGPISAILNCTFSGPPSAPTLVSVVVG